MLALNRKLLRNLWQTKGQAIAIILVIAAGVSMFIMYFSTFESLRLTRSAYYERYRFADVFASLKRAPVWLRERIARIPGVAQAETRVVVDVTLDVEGLSEPAKGRLISIPDRQVATLNDVFLRRGRYIEPGRADESAFFKLTHYRIYVRKYRTITDGADQHADPQSGRPRKSPSVLVAG